MPISRWYLGLPCRSWCEVWAAWSFPAHQSSWGSSPQGQHLSLGCPVISPDSNSRDRRLRSVKSHFMLYYVIHNSIMTLAKKKREDTHCTTNHNLSIATIGYRTSCPCFKKPAPLILSYLKNSEFCFHTSFGRIQKFPYYTWITLLIWKNLGTIFPSIVMKL